MTLDPPRANLAGTIRWAVVPYSPRPPFRLYAGEAHAPIVVDGPDQLVAAAQRGGDPEFTYLVPGKARPVLVLCEPPSAHHREVAALRLLRLSKLDPGQRELVRSGRDEVLLPLPPEALRLPEECAVIVSALVRVHVEAIAGGPALGSLDPEQMRDLGERVIRFFQLDTSRLLESRIAQLLEARGDR